MDTQLKEIDQIRRELTITIDKETHAVNYQKTLAKFSKKVRIDGFRPGKAPQSLIDKRFGGQVKTEYIEEYGKIYYYKALGELKVFPLSTGEIIDLSFTDDGSIVFVYEFETYPQGFTYEYEDLEVPFQPEEYTDNMCDRTIERLLQENAEEIPFDENDVVEIGDKLTIFDEDEDMEYASFYLTKELRADHDRVDVSDVLGKKLRDEFIGIVKEDDIVEKHRCQLVDAFHLKVPPLNDETAQVLGHDNVEQMRAKIKEDLQETIEKLNEKRLENEIAQAFGLRNNDNIMLPQSYLISSAKRIVQNQLGLADKDNVFSDISEDILLQIAENYRPMLIWGAAYERIATDHGIAVSEEEKQNALKRFADNFNISVEEFQQKYRDHAYDIIDSLLIENVIKWLKPYCRIVDPPVEPPQEDIVETDS